MLTLTEELLLISLDNEKGTVHSSAIPSIHYGVAGAILMELSLNALIQCNDKKLTFPDNKQNINDNLLNKLFVFLKENDESHSRPKYLNYWIQFLGNHIKSMKYIDLYLERLIEKGILTKTEEKHLVFFKKAIYSTNEATIEVDVVRKVKEAVLNDNQSVNEKTIMLIAFINACNLEKVIFSKEEYRDAKRNLKRILKEQPYGKTLSETILALQSAVIDVSGAATAAILSTNN